jgi:hypothetical protein
VILTQRKWIFDLPTTEKEFIMSLPVLSSSSSTRTKTRTRTGTTTTTTTATRKFSAPYSKYL